MTRDEKPAQPPRGLRLAVNGVLLLPFLIATWYFFAQPLWGLIAARQWQQIECEIVDSGTRTQRTSNGRTGAPNLAITYRYQHAGRVHITDDIDFYGGFAVRESVRRDFLERFPADSTRPCYVDPGDPARCVLDRGFRGVYLLGLIPLLISLLLWSGLRQALWPPVEPAEPAPTPAPATAGPVTLASSYPPRRRLAVAAVSSGLFFAVTAAFMGPASLLGLPIGLATLAALGWVGYQLLALANPVPRLTVSASAVAVGDTFELSWRLEGAASRLRNLRITLECSEWTSVQTGNKRRTRVDQLAAHRIHGDAVVASGSATVAVPADALATGAHGRNIGWTLHVVGEIERWPDLDDSFPITVLAAPQS